MPYGWFWIFHAFRARLVIEENLFENWGFVKCIGFQFSKVRKLVQNHWIAFWQYWCWFDNSANIFGAGENPKPIMVRSVIPYKSNLIGQIPRGDLVAKHGHSKYQSFEICNLEYENILRYATAMQNPSPLASNACQQSVPCFQFGSMKL